MRAIDLKVNGKYEIKDTPSPYCDIKVVKVLRPREEENIRPYIIVKCLQKTMSCRDPEMGYDHTRYVRPRDIIKRR